MAARSFQHESTGFKIEGRDRDWAIVTFDGGCRLSGFVSFEAVTKWLIVNNARPLCPRRQERPSRARANA